MLRTIPLLLVILLAACVNAEFTPAPGSPGFPAHRGEVRLLDAFPEEGSYDSVGVVIAAGSRNRDKKDLIEDLKKEAAKRGANALILQGDVKMRSRGGIDREKVLGAYALRLKE